MRAVTYVSSRQACRCIHPCEVRAFIPLVKHMVDATHGYIDTDIWKPVSLVLSVELREWLGAHVMLVQCPHFGAAVHGTELGHLCQELGSYVGSEDRCHFFDELFACVDVVLLPERG